MVDITTIEHVMELPREKLRGYMLGKDYTEKEAARETCEHCDLFEMASAQMCRDCPAVELLKRLKVIAESGAEEKK